MPDASGKVNRQIRKSLKMYGSRLFRRKYSVLGRFTRTWFILLIVGWSFSQVFIWLADQGYMGREPWGMIHEISSFFLGVSGMWVIVTWRLYNTSQKGVYGDIGVWPEDEDGVAYYATYGEKDRKSGRLKRDHGLLIQLRELNAPGGLPGLPDDVSHGGGIDNPYFDMMIAFERVEAGWTDEDRQGAMLRLREKYDEMGGHAWIGRGAMRDYPYDFEPTITVLCKDETRQVLEAHPHHRYDSTVYVAHERLPSPRTEPMKPSDFDKIVGDARASEMFYRAAMKQKSQDVLDKRQGEKQEGGDQQPVIVLER